MRTEKKDREREQYLTNKECSTSKYPPSILMKLCIFVKQAKIGDIKCSFLSAEMRL